MPARENLNTMTMTAPWSSRAHIQMFVSHQRCCRWSPGANLLRTPDNAIASVLHSAQACTHCFREIWFTHQVCKLIKLSRGSIHFVVDTRVIITCGTPLEMRRVHIVKATQCEPLKTGPAWSCTNQSRHMHV